MNQNSNNQKSSSECCVEDVSLLVQKLVRAFQLFERDQIKVHNFTTTQCYTLLALYENGAMSMQDLSDKMNLQSSTMTRIVDKLVKDQFIHRGRDENDRRVVLVQLTEKGSNSAIVLNRSLNDYYQRILNNLPNGKIDEVLDSTQQLIAAFDSANPNCC